MSRSVRIHLARFTPSESASRSRAPGAPSRPPILHAEADLLARTRGSAQDFVRLGPVDFDEIEARLLAYLEANT